MKNNPPILSFVVPCYNERLVLEGTIESLSRLLEDLKSKGIISPLSFAFYVDDGSTDDTWDIIQRCHEYDVCCRGLKLAGNVGHQYALLAGMMELPAEVDCVISIDADLQDDLDAIPKMLEEFEKGYDIVYGVRTERPKDSLSRRVTADLYYRFVRMMGVNIVYQHADYRLLNRPVIEALSAYSEVNLFLRGIFPGMGFTSTQVTYVRKPRQHGESNYTWFKMIALAWEGITSFSTFPLRISLWVSLMAILLGLIIGIHAMMGWMRGENVSGWTSLIITILLLGGMQLFCLGIIGEYHAKTYMETKRRPRYIVKTII